MMHTCPDGARTHLDRHGPLGTLVGVYYICPRCLLRSSAEQVLADTKRVLQQARAAGRL